jgi:hypothetical protein
VKLGDKVWVALDELRVNSINLTKYLSWIKPILQIKDKFNELNKIPFLDKTYPGWIKCNS